MTTVDDLTKDLAGTLSLSQPSNDTTSTGGLPASSSQNASPATATATAKDGGGVSAAVPAPALPPSMAATSSSMDFLAEMEKHPIFMQSLQGQDSGENAELEALKALAYEGTPAEIADNFVTQGNEMFREKRWKEAVEFYSKAVAAIVGSEVERKKRKAGVPPTPKKEKNSASSKPVADGELKEGEGGKIIELGEAEEPEVDDAKEEVKEKVLLEKALANRAAGNLELQNYRQTKIDTIAVLKSNPSNLKASYRLARAHFALDHIPQALNAVEFGLAKSQDIIMGTHARAKSENDLKAVMNQHTALEKLKVQVLARKEVLDKRAREKKEQEDLQRNQALALSQALKAKKIPLIKTANPPSDLPDTIKLALSDPLDPKSEILFPTTILYPLVSQSDIISSFPGSSNLQEQLSHFLLNPENPPDWDKEKKEYTVESVGCFMLDLKGEGLIKVGKKMSLQDVLGSGVVRGVVDGIVAIMVVPRGEAGTKWKNEFKERNRK